MSTPSITVCSRGMLLGRGGRNPVTAEIAAMGCRVTQVKDGPLDLATDDVVLMMGNANWFPSARRQLVGAARSGRPGLVVWHTEPLPPPRAAGLPRPRLHLREVARILRRDPNVTDVYSNERGLRSLARQGLPDLLVVSTLGRRERLAERGIGAEWVPLGYRRGMGRDLGLPRDVDALFLGEEVPRRRRLIGRLRRSGVNLLAVGGWSDPAYWGRNRTQLLNRTKILLNLQRYPGELSGSHLILGMANKALVISEPIYNPAPYVPGQHYVSAAIEDMPAVIDYYLTHDAERERITGEAHRFVTREVTLERSVARLLALVAERLGPRRAGEPAGASGPA